MPPHITKEHVTLVGMPRACAQENVFLYMEQVVLWLDELFPEHCLSSRIPQPLYRFIL